VFPCAGPPCFLDDELFHLNDIHGDPSNIFCDQRAFLDYMREQGETRGHLVVPGSVVEFQSDRCSISHPITDKEIDAIFSDKGAYLEAYRARKAPQIKAAKAAWPRGRVELLPSLKELIEPLLWSSDLTCAGIGGRVLLDCSVEGIVIDFLDRSVYRWSGQSCRYKLCVDAALVEACLLNGDEDWVNSLFLSCRFEAERDGPYNEYVYNFFKCLSPERLQYAEGYYAEQANGSELFRVDGHMVQRRCPHLKADLTRFGRVQDGILTCAMHGWQFEVATGRCLTSDQCRLYTRPVQDSEEPFE
jgi:UDP-MurNAc hydroxylase